MNSLKRAIDTDLSNLRVTERARAEIYRNAMEGKKVKKKLSAALIAALILTLMATAALAYSLLSNQYFEDVAKLESERGYYDEWPLDTKLAMLKLMKDYGVSMDETEADALLAGGMDDKEREERVDALMIGKYGDFGRADLISLERVLLKERGDRATWTMEDKAWYSSMLIESGLMGGDDDVFVMPPADAITPENAVARAKEAILAAWELPEDALNDYNVVWEYLTHVSDAERAGLHYEVTFTPKDGEGRAYDCALSNDGRVLSSVDGEFYASPAEKREIAKMLDNLSDGEARAAYQAYGKARGLINPIGQASLPFEEWPLEDKMALSDLVRPIVQKNMAGNPDYADWAFAVMATLRYGLPDEGALTQEAALDIARAALKERLSVSDALLPYCDKVTVFYDVTDPDAPLWKITFTASAHRDEVKALGGEPRAKYRVLIDAHTGDITYAFSYVPGDGVGGMESALRDH